MTDTPEIIGGGVFVESYQTSFAAKEEGQPSPMGFRVYGDDAFAKKVQEDSRTAAAAERLRTGRLGYRLFKRTFDIVFSSLVIVVGFIPIGCVCIAICAESKGSPIYAQKRMGRNGKAINVLKLRSMHVDADNVEKYLSPEQLAQWKVERKVDNDPRITKVGKFIRATSIDEIPQFLNVWTGTLSVIGPRPITRDELEQHFTAQQQKDLLSVRPGITGLWQAGERNGATFESGRRQEIELSYIRDAGVGLDWKIFCGTFGAMFGKRRSGR